jgi:isopentenyldiphosphate isomerase
MKKNNDELLDLVNEKDEVIGTVWKSEAHRDPTKIHREAGIVVFNDKEETLIQQRSASKSNPLSWKIAAAGHIKSGENPAEAIKREVYEELGIKVKPIFFKKEFHKRVGLPGPKEARFSYGFYAIVSGRSKMKLDKSEVECALWIKPEKLLEFSKINDWDINGFSHRFIIEIYNKFIKK